MPHHERVDEERWLSRVRGLLAKAESTEFPGEAEALTAKAMELMAKYGIEEALLAASMPGSKTVSDRVITIAPPYLGGKQTLVHILARHLGCRAITLTKNGTKGRVHVFGYPGDCERVEYLFTSLLVQIYTGLAREPQPVFESLRSFRFSWVTGFTAAVNGRLKEAARRAEAEAAVTTTSVALVLANRSHLVDQRFAQEYPKFGYQKVSAGSSRSGYAHGTQAGKLADLGGTRITG